MRCLNIAHAADHADAKFLGKAKVIKTGFTYDQADSTLLDRLEKFHHGRTLGQQFNTIGVKADDPRIQIVLQQQLKIIGK